MITFHTNKTHIHIFVDNHPACDRAFNLTPTKENQIPNSEAHHSDRLCGICRVWVAGYEMALHQLA